MIYAFFWMFFWEFLQNAPIIVASVVLLRRWKTLGPWLRVGLSALGGSATAFLFTLTETTKLSVTILPAVLPDGPLGLARTCLLFSSILLGVALYYRSTWSSAKSDIIAGVVVGIILAITDFWSLLLPSQPESISIARVLFHALAYVIIFPAAMVAVRKAAGARWKPRILWSLFAIAMMSAVIVGIDCMPYLKAA